MTYAPVKDLPEPLRAALTEIAYTRRDVEVLARDRVTPGTLSGAGLRAFFCMVNLATGEREIAYGAWGGQNMFAQNVVDDLRQPVPLTPGVAVIDGVVGHTTSARIYLHADNVAKMLPAPPDVSARERWILACYKGLNSRGRASEWERHGKPGEDELSALADRGFLKLNAKGVATITVAGKNAVGNTFCGPVFAPREKG